MKSLKNPEDKAWKVYKYTLKNDGRFYIGQTCDTLEERAGSNGHRYKGCRKFYYAIQKYGWENFIPEIIADNLTLKEANELENKLIVELDAMNNGFNLCEGGDNHIPSQETKELLSKKLSGKNNPNYGKPRSEETKRKIGKANSISQLGKHHSEETKKKMSDTHKKNSKLVLCIEDGKVYRGPADAAQALGHFGPYSGSHISEVCRGTPNRKTAYGYHWRYLTEKEIEEYEQSNL